MSRGERWDRRFLALADHVAAWSKDPSSKFGAVIVGEGLRVLSLGYNGFPRGVDDDVPSRWERPGKYLWIEHAERNAIYNAREPLSGATLYIRAAPCADCARAIVQAGIVRVVTRPEATWGSGFLERWWTSIQATQALFREGGVVWDEVGG